MFVKYKMLKAVCSICNKEFNTYNKNAKYCSRGCYAVGLVKHKDLECSICGKMFHPQTSTQKYCSHKCLGLAQRGRDDSICPVCGKHFYSRNNKNQKYCSKECYTKSQKVIYDKKCEWCGNIFKPRSNESKYCCRECLHKALSVNNKKEQVLYIIKCEQCGKEFEAKKKDRKYCSNKCCTESHRVQNSICPVCGEEFHRKGLKQKFCSKECHGIYLSHQWETLTDEEKKKILEPFTSAAKNVESKTNLKYVDFLRRKGFEDIKTEFRLGGYSYDIKVGNTLIEINPTYTHNSTEGPMFNGIKGKPKEESYHYKKMKAARDNGYRCIMVWDWDDREKIAYLLDDNKIKLYARKCEVKQIKYEDCHQFIEDYHLQGDTRKSKNNIYIGLYYNNKLVECMSFGKPRSNKNYEREILRLCSHKDYKVIGGANKIFNNFLNIANPNSVLSYCDKSKFDGGVYYKLGFKLLRSSNRTKHWAKDSGPKDKRHITGRSLLQLGYDKWFGTNYGKGTDNEELMKQNGYVEIYDCGQATFVRNK